MDIKIVQNRILELAIAVRDILESNNIPYIMTYGTLLGAVRHQGFIPWDDDFDLFIFDEHYDEAISFLKKNLPNDMMIEDKETEPMFFHGWARLKDNKTIVDYALKNDNYLYKNKGLGVDLFRPKRMKEYEENKYRIEEHIAYLNRKIELGIRSKEEFSIKLEELKCSLEKEIEKISQLTEDEKINTPDIYTFSSIVPSRYYLKDLFPLKKYKFENTYFYGPQNPSPFLTCCYGDYMTLPPIEKRRIHSYDVMFI